MSWTESLLTPEATTWERAIEATSAERWPLAWEILRTLHSPDEIPLDKLPILAWALSVDLWDPNWAPAKKRSVVRQAIADHGLKGTVAGIRRYLEIEESNLVQLLAPPQRTFASRTLTKAEYDAWLAQMPQLRVYQQSKPGVGIGYDFYDRGFANDAFARSDLGAAHLGRFPYLYKAGVLTPLKTATEVVTVESRPGVDFERYSIPGLGGLTFVGSSYLDADFIEDAVRAPELVTAAIDRSYIHETSALALDTITPGLTPVDVRTQRKSEIGNAGPYLFVGDFASRSFFIGWNEARWMIYDVLYLLDPAIAAPMVDALSFLNHTRLAMADFTFEAMVDASTVSLPSVSYEGDFVGELWARFDSHEKIDRALDAVAVAKGYRDKALVTFETTRPRAWSDGLPLDGSVPLWSRVPATL